MDDDPFAARTESNGVQSNLNADEDTLLNGEPTAPVATTKRRKQRPRLTSDLLLSEKGLHYVRIQGPKIKYAGKGNEAEDLAKLIRFYKAWSHDLFPRAHFKEFMHRSMKLCRDKRMKAALQGMHREFKYGDSGTYLSGETVGDTRTPPEVVEDEGMRETDVDVLARIQLNRDRALARIAERQREAEAQKEGSAGADEGAIDTMETGEDDWLAKAFADEEEMLLEEDQQQQATKKDEERNDSKEVQVVKDSTQLLQVMSDSEEDEVAFPEVSFLKRTQSKQTVESESDDEEVQISGKAEDSATLGEERGMVPDVATVVMEAASTADATSGEPDMNSLSIAPEETMDTE